MQHGIDRRLEQGEIPEPRHPTGHEDLPNSLHLGWRERALFPNLTARKEHTSMEPSMDLRTTLPPIARAA
jgi:hypothetical protein